MMTALGLNSLAFIAFCVYEWCSLPDDYDHQPAHPYWVDDAINCWIAVSFAGVAVFIIWALVEVA